jgi:CRP-like cAMP-binding protein
MSATAANLRWELQRHTLFEFFEARELDTLLRTAAIEVFRARQMLFHEGDPGGSMYVILSGRVKVSAYSAAGKECVLSFAGPGEVLGEITLLDGGSRTASGCALEDTRALHIARRDFLPVLESNPRAALHIVGVLCERLRTTSRMVEDTVFLAAAPRLARALIRLLGMHGEAVKLPQSTLGAHVGLMRESVNRQLRLWEEDGVIRSGEDGIVVVKRDVLERIAELS